MKRYLVNIDMEWRVIFYLKSSNLFAAYKRLNSDSRCFLAFSVNEIYKHGDFSQNPDRVNPISVEPIAQGLLRYLYLKGDSVI